MVKLNVEEKIKNNVIEIDLNKYIFIDKNGNVKKQLLGLKGYTTKRNLKKMFERLKNAEASRPIRKNNHSQAN